MRWTSAACANLWTVLLRLLWYHVVDFEQGEQSLDMHMQLSVRPLCRWKYVGGNASAARSSNVTIKGLLHLLACMRQGLQVHAGMPPPNTACSKHIHADKHH